MKEHENKVKVVKTRSIHAGEVLDKKMSEWAQRSWEQRRNIPPNAQPFCDEAASHALAKLVQAGGAMPITQVFVTSGDLLAWCGDFVWGKAWIANRDLEFWAWAKGDGVSDARVEISGSVSQWDDELLDEFVQSLVAGAVEKAWP
jgi:hypothetical protein